jgi:LPS-assembly lipoprotein
MLWCKRRHLALQLCVLLSALSLVACGFALRGTQQLPAGLSKIYIDTSKPGSELIVHLKRQLRSTTATVADYPAADVAVLKIRQTCGRRTLSVGSDAKALEYEVYCGVTFSVDSPDEGADIAEKQIRLTRDYIFDRLGVLAAGEKENILQQDMERELARMVIDQLTARPIPIK